MKVPKRKGLINKLVPLMLSGGGQGITTFFNKHRTLALIELIRYRKFLPTFDIHLGRITRVSDLRKVDIMLPQPNSTSYRVCYLCVSKHVGAATTSGTTSSRDLFELHHQEAKLRVFRRQSTASV